MLKRSTPFADEISRHLRSAQMHMEGTLFIDAETDEERIAIYWNAIIGNDLADNNDPRWQALSLDASAIERGIDLRTQPLWLNDTPEWAVRGWEMLATELTRRAPYWQTLVRWYEDRLHGDDWAADQGRPALPALEIARASLPDRYWRKGGKAVNEAIAKLEAYFWHNAEIDDPDLRELVENVQTNDALPGQTPAAFQFTTASDRPIDLAPVLPEDRLADDAARREDFAELRAKVEDLAAEGSNRLGRLGGPIERLRALGADLSGIRAKLLWSRINTIRILLHGHQAALDIAAKGGERDERQLDGVIADKLTDLVETANLFVIGDANLMELDARRSGPQDLAAAQSAIALIEPALRQAAVDAAITTPAAGEVILEQIENVRTADDTLAGRQAAELGVNTSRNVVSAFLARARAILSSVGRGAKAEPAHAWKETRAGLYRAAGALAFTETMGITNVHAPMLTFIAQHGQALIRYIGAVFNNPAAIHFIERILQAM